MGHRWEWVVGSGGPGWAARERHLRRIYVSGEGELAQLYNASDSRYAGKLVRVDPTGEVWRGQWDAYGFLGWPKPGHHGDVENLGRFLTYEKGQRALRAWVLASEVERLALEGKLT